MTSAPLKISSKIPVSTTPTECRDCDTRWQCMHYYRNHKNNGCVDHKLFSDVTNPKRSDCK